MLKKIMVIKLVLVTLLTLLVTAPNPVLVSAGPESCETRVNNTQKKLQECVTLEGVREHQAALQAIADANGGTRAAGTQGYTDSVNYVKTTMEAAGWTVTLNEFPFTRVLVTSVVDKLFV
jgi:hypothetical protein